MVMQTGFEEKTTRGAIAAICFDRLTGCHSLLSSLPLTIAIVAYGVEDALHDIDCCSMHSKYGSTFHQWSFIQLLPGTLPRAWT
jgi:hypothetical protein